jgi:ABC-type nitrate/sulfonate/bicarbonate transport system ATPase subunit
MVDMSSTNASSTAEPAAPLPQTGAPAISFQEISKSFTSSSRGRLEVLRTVTFDVSPGEIVAIVGPSGSGKSTLLNIAAGLMMPDRGRVLVMGQDTAGTVDWKCVGYMFQDDRLLPWRVAWRNVALALEARPSPAAERTRRAHAELELVGLGEFADAYPHQLSGGMRSRVALARSLATDPHILLMDEPFSRLDAQTRATMHRELLRIHGLRRMSVLFVTHDVEEAVVLAHRIVVLSARPGRVRRQIDLDLPQPRVGMPEAVALTNELRALLEAEPMEDAAS